MEQRVSIKRIICCLLFIIGIYWALIAHFGLYGFGSFLSNGEFLEKALWFLIALNSALGYYIWLGWGSLAFRGPFLKKN